MIGLTKKFHSIVLSISNWASKNKFKTKILIGILQTGIALSGIGIGTNLNDLGFTFSANASYLFSGTFLLAVIALIKQKRASKSEPLKSFFRNKIAQAIIALSSLMLMTVVGNNIGRNNPTNSPVGYIIEKNHFGLIEKKCTTDNSSVAIEKEAKIDKAALVALYVFLAILMGIILMALTCAVWCWAILSAEVGVIAIAVIATIFMILLAIYVISSMRRSIDKNEAAQTTL